MPSEWMDIPGIESLSCQAIQVLDDSAYPSHIAPTLPIDEEWGSSQDEQWSFVFWSNKKRVYEPGEEFHVQVTDDFVKNVRVKDLYEESCVKEAVQQFRRRENFS